MLGGNLLTNLVTLKKSVSKQICWQKWVGVNLAVDLVSVTKSVSL